MTILTEKLKKDLGLVYAVEPHKLPFIYELDSKQYKLMQSCIENNNICFATIDSLDTDQLDKQEKYKKEQEQINDLILLGLVTDVSERFKQQIEVSKINNDGRGFKVFALTNDAVLLFADKKDKNWVN